MIEIPGVNERLIRGGLLHELKQGWAGSVVRVGRSGHPPLINVEQFRNEIITTVCFDGWSGQF